MSDILSIEYGELPPSPQSISGKLLYSYWAALPEPAEHAQYQVDITFGGREFHFLLDLLLPAGDGPKPVFLNGDGCWFTTGPAVRSAVVRRGYILATFNRLEFSHDNPMLGREGGIYDLFPDREFGALAAWAWGYRRCVDFLSTLPAVDTERIGVIGHSRGGKTTLLAGALDERISLTVANGSGCGGAGSFRLHAPDAKRAETLADIVTAFPHWFSKRLAEFAHREDELPFDQHALIAAIAPRAFLATEACDDHWANPYGTCQMYYGAREVYELLGAPDRIGLHTRDGGHEHTREDWLAALDFAAKVWA